MVSGMNVEQIMNEKRMADQAKNSGSGLDARHKPILSNHAIATAGLYGHILNQDSFQSIPQGPAAGLRTGDASHKYLGGL